MKDFNIAKYLKENSLGSHSILGAYVDLHALKEEEVGNNKPVDEVPYVGDEEKLDGFGDTFDQVDPVEELDNSITGDRGWQYDDEDFSSERDKLDRMMGLAHEYFEKVSPIVRKTIDALRADGFDDQDIIDFLATDFTLEEEVSVSSSGVEMEEASNGEFSNVVNTLNGIAKKVKPTGAKLSFDDDSFSDAIIIQVVTEDGDFKLQKAVHAEVKKLVQKANSGFKVSRIEQDSPGRISFSIDKSKLDEELGGEEEWQWSARDQQGKLYGTLYVKPMGDTLVVTADDGMPATRYSKEDIIDAMGRGEFLRFRGKNFALDTRMKDWANS